MDSASHDLSGAANDLMFRWERLDIQRFTGQAVGGATDSAAVKPHLAEYQALSDLEEASFNRARRPSLVRNAIAYLDEAYQQAASANPEATRRVAGRRLAECLRAYRTLPTGTVPLTSLNASAHTAWGVLQDAEDEGSSSALLLRSSLGEFFKEAFTSETIRTAFDAQGSGGFANPDARSSENNSYYYLLDMAFEVLAPIQDQLASGSLLERHDLITAATSTRHLAVVHEYYYFRPGVPPDVRADHLHKWLRLSVDAAGICADQGEFNTQAYALLNKAAALAELTSSEIPSSQLPSLIEGANDVQAAQDLFTLVGDDRGIAWSGIHLTRILARQYELSEKTATSEELEDLIQAMFETAIDAESNSRRIDDEIAQGLSNLYLCAAEREAQRLGVKNLSVSDESEIADRARKAAATLSSTHRLPQAARALQIAAQCEFVVSRRSTDLSAKSTSRGRAMKDLAEAISILDSSGDLGGVTSDRLLMSLHDSVAGAVPRWRF